MMIMLLHGDRGGVDFSEPVRMTEVQKAGLVEFLQEMFAVVTEEEVTEFRTDRLGERTFPRVWDSEELALLLEPHSVAEVSSLLGRTWMSVTIMRGGWVGGFLEWVSSEGYDLARDDVRQLIDEYLEERREKQRERKEAKAVRERRLKRLEKEVRRLKEKLKMRELLVRAGQATHEVIEEVEQELQLAKHRLAEFQDSEGL
ncbi:MAG: hypothetical protein ACE5IJ_04560 [Thermoplasmata archaeon]